MTFNVIGTQNKKKVLKAVQSVIFVKMGKPSLSAWAKKG